MFLGCHEFGMDGRVCGPDWTGLNFIFEWIFLLTGLRATNSGVDCRVFGVIAIFATLVFVASGLAVAISGL